MALDRGPLPDAFELLPTPVASPDAEAEDERSPFPVPGSELLEGCWPVDSGLAPSFAEAAAADASSRESRCAVSVRRRAQVNRQHGKPLIRGS